MFLDWKLLVEGDVMHPTLTWIMLILSVTTFLATFLMWLTNRC